ncbi:hydrolase [Salmonella phage KM16]|uniref:hydrolase n=1 Tax=Salmonella phage KM16 TaxID=2797303 RepID=UPI002492E57D|nr:hydrolase [Salmonella phage KM16]
MINLKDIKRNVPDINEFYRQICEVQPMPGNIIPDLIKALDGKTLVFVPKEKDND